MRWHVALSWFSIYTVYIYINFLFVGSYLGVWFMLEDVRYPFFYCELNAHTGIAWLF